MGTWNLKIGQNFQQIEIQRQILQGKRRQAAAQEIKFASAKKDLETVASHWYL